MSADNNKRKWRWWWWWCVYIWCSRT